MSREKPVSQSPKISAAARLAIVAARFNDQIVGELLRGCCERLTELKISADRVEIFRVPGAFELPLAAKLAAETKRFAAVICLGAVVRGDTPHFEYVAGETARGIQDVSLQEKLPVIFGVLTTDTQQQAIERIGGAHGHVGRYSADAAVEMIALAEQLRPT